MIETATYDYRAPPLCSLFICKLTLIKYITEGYKKRDNINL